MLKCPVDRVPLIEQLVGSTGFATCPDCSGLWLPRSARVEFVDPVGLAQASRTPIQDSLRPRRGRGCPRCKIYLVAEHVEGIEIDRCYKCDGIWLDAGEYEAVRHRIAVPRDPSEPPPRSARHYGKADIVFDIVSALLELIPK